MIPPAAKDAARTRVRELVEQFRRDEQDYLRPDYNETQARTDFISPLLAAFGWDVYNTLGQPLSLREVIEEATVEISDESQSRKPDYELRLARQRKLFVEAKKPNKRIERDRAAAFQTRRYGYSASLPISVLTNFFHLAVYDCIPAPAETDEAHVARLHLFQYDEFDDRFDELWDILSRETVYSGEFDRRFSVAVSHHGVEQFDDYFLGQVRSWRTRLAVDIHANTPGLSAEDLTYAVQLFLSRIVFLRICEDRDLEKYETLRSLNPDGTFADLTEVLKRADAFYDSGLFDLMADAPLGITISDETLRDIIEELYYPRSPYTFAVVETEVLGNIYEQFLGEVISITPSGTVEILPTPEAREGGGVVPTPAYIVDVIVERTISPKVVGKGPDELTNFTVADICCGSGTFLLGAYQFLLDHYLSWYLNHSPSEHTGRQIYEASSGQWRLTFQEKRRILLEHIRGVDIDPNAAEVTRLSLLLKLIEDETGNDLKDYVSTTSDRALPNLEKQVSTGNSLISHDEWSAIYGPLTPAQISKINPLTWSEQFPDEMARGGFDVVVCNPPYIRIQNMMAYSPDEVAFYQHQDSPYMSSNRDNFDKYALFIERAVMLTQANGRIGVIIPHKFMTIQSGRVLRRLLSEHRFLHEIVHFGVKQVFGPGTSNYTCILVLDKDGRDRFTVEMPDRLEEWRYSQLARTIELPADSVSDQPWEFAEADFRAIVDRVKASSSQSLDDLAEIFVGVQTSADSIYIFEPVAEDKQTVSLHWNGRDWPIEREILRPTLYDQPLSPYVRPQANAYMIFPYDVQGEFARLFSPKEMADRFPLCWTYLTARRPELERRNITGGPAGQQQWYQFGRSQSLTKFSGPKIILPILSLEPRYAFDDTNLVVTGGGNGPYYMIRPRSGSGLSNQFLLAVLNHPLSEALVRVNTSPFRGGYYSHGKQFIKGLPIPDPGEEARNVINGRVEELIATLQRAATATSPQERLRARRQATALHVAIENLVSQAFGVDDQDMEIVRAVPVPG